VILQLRAGATRATSVASLPREIGDVTLTSRAVAAVFGAASATAEAASAANAMSDKTKRFTDPSSND
jgi:hypothetical protein